LLPCFAYVVTML